MILHADSLERIFVRSRVRGVTRPRLLGSSSPASDSTRSRDGPGLPPSQVKSQWEGVFQPKPLLLAPGVNARTRTIRSPTPFPVLWHFACFFVSFEGDDDVTGNRLSTIDTRQESQRISKAS